MYVEAFKESHVAEAVRGLRNVLISRGVRLVPLKEMVDAITVNTKAKKIVGAPSTMPFPSTLGTTCAILQMWAMQGERIQHAFSEQPGVLTACVSPQP